MESPSEGSGRKKGWEGQQQQTKRSSGVIEESIKRGDAIKEDCETSDEREATIEKECEEHGITFYPEDDWSMPERLAEDERRAKAKASQRKRNTRNQQSRDDCNMDNGRKSKYRNGTSRKKKDGGKRRNTSNGINDKENGRGRKQTSQKGEAGAVGGN